MKLLIIFFKRITYLITAVLAGMLLFLLLFSFSADKTVLSPRLHKNLFEKHDIYSQTYDFVNSSMPVFFDNVKKYSPLDPTSQEKLLSLIESSITPEVVKSNLDSIREGLFEYFRGNTNFLPDISFSIPPNLSNNELDIYQMIPDKLTEVNKINLSAVLMYINRSDIYDWIRVLKLTCYIISVLPMFSLLLLIVTSIVGFVICKKLVNVFKWIATALLSGAVLCLLASAGIWMYLKFILPGNIMPLSMSIPLKTKTIYNYVYDSVIPLSIILFTLGLLLILLCLVIFIIKKYAVSHSITMPFLLKGSKKLMRVKVVKYSVYIILALAVFALVRHTTVLFKDKIHSNEFASAISKIKGVNSTTHVIPAQDETIYSLEVKLVDEQTGQPLENTIINIRGKSKQDSKEYNEQQITNEKGTVKFSLSKGTFHLSFVPDQFPEGYQIPSPFFVDLKTAGTTVITINISSVKKEDWGIIEVEVLDKKNKPVPNIELAVEGRVSAPGNPDRVFSRTNRDGIAVFKLNEDVYKIIFTGNGLPPYATLPNSFYVRVEPDSVNRYTIRLR